jgi:iron complex transport system ATP-binding protein
MLPGPALRIVGLTVRFGERPALSEVDLEVRPGEFVALAGPNGSGKTTLLRAALGLQDRAAGQVTLFGEELARLPIRERARRVAWVPQEEAPRDDVALERYVLYGRYPHLGWLEGETAEDRARASETLREVGLADRAKDGILEISGGERQRVLLARALAQEAPLLLLDEPTSHLDIGHQLDLLGRVRALARRRHLAVLAAIHDLNLAARYADRIVVLAHGRVVADGPPETVLSPLLLRNVWGIAAQLRRDDPTGLPYLVPRIATEPVEASVAPDGLGPVHVVAGGGSASRILQELTEAGLPVTVGALNLLDSDAEAAAALGIPVALEAPFAPLSESVRSRHRTLLGEADLIVVAPFAVGPSNLANLEDVAAVPGPVTILLVEGAPEVSLDFTQGRATEIRSRLRARGARSVAGSALLEEIQRERAARARHAAAPAPATVPR